VQLVRSAMQVTQPVEPFQAEGQAEQQPDEQQAWWKGKFYQTKQVKPIVAEQGNDLIVVTVYVFYLGGGK